MSATLTKDFVLIQSFRAASVFKAPKKGVVLIPAAANSHDGVASDDSIFRTTEK